MTSGYSIRKSNAYGLAVVVALAYFLLFVHWRDLDHELHTIAVNDDLQRIRSF